MSYDERKRQDNIEKHGIDLAECERVFDAPFLTDEDDRMDYGEVRLSSVGLLDGRVVRLVWTERASGPHLISCREAEKHDVKRYFKTFFYR
jgi:uncharacterized DUF497 family protein